MGHRAHSPRKELGFLSAATKYDYFVSSSNYQHCSSGYMHSRPLSARAIWLACGGGNEGVDVWGWHITHVPLSPQTGPEATSSTSSWSWSCIAVDVRREIGLRGSRPTPRGTTLADRYVTGLKTKYSRQWPRFGDSTRHVLVFAGKTASASRWLSTAGSSNTKHEPKSYG